jgi:hypothetical protein
MPAGSQARPFGIASFSMQATEADPAHGLINDPYSFTQASGHPFALTSTVQFASEGSSEDQPGVSTGDPKDVAIDLPPGLVANPQAIPRCSLGRSEHCPTDTQVGMFVLHFAFEGSPVAIAGPIVNLTPTENQAAELGLETLLGTFLLTGRVAHTAEGYAFAIVGNGLPMIGLRSMEITLWGVPAASAHDPQRGITCIGSGADPYASCEGGNIASGLEQVALLTMPGNCSPTPPKAVAWADSWEEPGLYARAQSDLPTMTGCEGLPFSPEVVMRPEALSPEQPVGIGLSIKIPQFGESDRVAAPELHNAIVSLPQGMSINAGVANGLQGCDPTGPAGINIPTGLNTGGEPLDPGEVGLGEELGPGGEPELAPGHCPQGSILGTAEASTPLLAHPLEGRVYIATPGCGGPDQRVCSEQDAVDGNLYRLYIELGGKESERDEGVIIKLAATVQANPATGQLTVSLTESPQLPLSELSLHLSGGDRALLANPTTCGAATTTSELEPWSAPYTPDASPSSYYDLTGCTNTALNPGFIAGSIDARAGAPTPFTLNVTRHSGEPYLSAIQIHTPPGLSATLSSVPVCEEQLASTGGCPASSRIGSSEVAVGAGSQPLYMPGAIYLTGPYQGSPFSLSIVTNAQAGPLNLGLIVIRARIDVDPSTATLTITTPSLPQILLGVPLRIQRVSLNIDRPGLILNPTNCKAQQVTARIADSQGVSTNVSNAFASGGCKNLAFKPKLQASTSGHTSFATGASLNIKLTFPKKEQGTEANLAQIKIALPKQLPSRLTTLQSACVQATFNTNPAMCPTASIVGIAKAQTPVLPGKLTGPVYFVTHGHDALPSPTIILQGDGVRLNVSGSTIIDKTGVAHVAFNAIPDVPIRSLELYLPQGPHSLAGANTNLCKPTKTTTKHGIQRKHEHTSKDTSKAGETPANLTMPSELLAQNGARIHQTTKIHVADCTSAKRSPRSG